MSMLVQPLQWAPLWYSLPAGYWLISSHKSSVHSWLEDNKGLLKLNLHVYSSLLYLILQDADKGQCPVISQDSYVIPCHGTSFLVPIPFEILQNYWQPALKHENKSKVLIFIEIGHLDTRIGVVLWQTVIN